MLQGEWEQHRPRRCILGVEQDQVNHPHPWGKMGFSQSQRGNLGLGMDTDALGRQLVTTTVETPGEPSQILWELGLLGASECLVPNQPSEPLELKTPELSLKWPQGRRSWA